LCKFYPHHLKSDIAANPKVSGDAVKCLCLAGAVEAALWLVAKLAVSTTATIAAA
jgi:hypothetical protein